MESGNSSRHWFGKMGKERKMKIRRGERLFCAQGCLPKLSSSLSPSSHLPMFPPPLVLNSNCVCVHFLFYESEEKTRGEGER